MSHYSDEYEKLRYKNEAVFQAININYLNCCNPQLKSVKIRAIKLKNCKNSDRRVN